MTKKKRPEDIPVWYKDIFPLGSEFTSKGEKWLYMAVMMMINPLVVAVVIIGISVLVILYHNDIWEYGVYIKEFWIKLL